MSLISFASHSPCQSSFYYLEVEWEITNEIKRTQLWLQWLTAGQIAVAGSSIAGGNYSKFWFADRLSNASRDVVLLMTARQCDKTTQTAAPVFGPSFIAAHSRNGLPTTPELVVSCCIFRAAATDDNRTDDHIVAQLGWPSVARPTASVLHASIGFT